MEIDIDQLKIYRRVEEAENFLCRAFDQLNDARQMGADSELLTSLNGLMRDCLLTISAALRELLPENVIAMRTRNLERS